MHRILSIGLLVLVSQAIAEEEKFYPIISSDGSVQVIKAPADKEKAAKARQERKAATPVDKPTSGEREASSSLRAGAAYDSDEYVDSELLDNQDSKTSEKSRFYIIPDEQGTQVNQEGMAFTPSHESSPIFDAVPVEERHRPVDENLVIWKDTQAISILPSLPKCLGKDEISKIKEMQPGAPESLLIEKTLYGFLEPHGIVAIYRIPGEGLRTVIASSFSRTDRKPRFFHPYLAFFDGHGCLSRVISNFYESHYPANQRRHPMLRASLVVHAEESFMVVMVPKENQTKSVASLPYQYSRFGQLKFTVKKQ